MALSEWLGMLPLLENTLHISADERRSLDNTLHTLHFVSRRASSRPDAFVSKPSSVIKDYILSPETYVLAE
jgi:hypothetical protein